MNDSYYFIIISILAGIIPALIWLAYWLQEDKINPEPKKLIFASFLFGMLVVPSAAIFNNFFKEIILGSGALDLADLYTNSYPLAVFLILIWAAAEEFFKFVAAYFGGIRTKENDEPLDPIIYLITAALGFAALENILYVYGRSNTANTIVSLIEVGNIRFIGATLLHVVSSATIGIFIAFSYYKKSEIKHRFIIWGFIIATALHTIFNYLIIRGIAKGEDKFISVSFAIVWTSIIVIILLLERFKKVKK